MDVKETILFIQEWIKKYHISSKTDGYVIGISGGIDSAVTSTLIAKAGIPLLCLEMPIHQDIEQVNRASEHLSSLKEIYPNVSSLEINLSNVFDSFKEKVPTKNHRSELALANTRARLRMSTLYYYGQINNYLVAGTGNKIEDFGIGFFTKYGDGGVDISPIADLLKSEVYLIAHELGVSKTIIKAPPTDGLWGDNKTDEDQIGATYTELEWAMNQNKMLDNLNSRQLEVLKIYKSLNLKNQHKILPIPVCIIPKNLK